jgi:DNA uptake protein ComE-like DNA-binding protein
MQNDSLVREFEEFRRTLTVKEPSVAVSEKRERLLHRDSSPQASIPLHAERSSSRAAYPAKEKLSKGETVSLNETDTTVWKKIPGIGSVYAARIVKYRNLLGGFVRVEQLLEVYGIDQELFSRIAVYIESDGNFRKIQVNQSEFKELLRHPYLNYKQVQAITGLRRRKGNITSIRELSMLDEFTPEDILRLEPYLEF